MPEANKNN